MRFQKSLVVVLVLALTLVGVSTNRTVAADEKVLVIGYSEDTTSLDPARGFEPGGAIVLKAAYDTLVTFPPDSTDKIIPNLATGWKISGDGKTYTFTLKDGVVFSSGNPVTADDVVFSFNRTKNIKGNPSFLAATIDSVSAPDKKTVVLKLNAVDPAILAKLVFPAFSVTEAAAVKAQGGIDAADADKNDKAETWLNNNSVGTGPYILTKWDKQTEVDLVRNPKYWGQAAAFDRVILRNIPQAATQKAALEAGDVDIAMDITADQVSSVQGNSDLKLYQGLSTTVVFLLMNQDKTIGGPLSDPNVQKAVRLAIDYPGILKLSGGSAITPPSVIPVGIAGAFSKDKAVKPDVESAKKLLAGAGFANGLTIELEYPDFTYGGVNMGTMAQKIQSDLKAAGITANLKPGEVQVALQNYRQGKEAFGLWFWLPDYIDAIDYLEFLPEGVVGKRANWTDANADAEIKGLRDKAKVELDDAKRADLFAQIQTYLQDKGPFVPFLQPGIQIGYRANVKGFAYNAQWRIDPATFSK
jgi:peptide/nickel transport system substrate-binding protein